MCALIKIYNRFRADGNLKDLQGLRRGKDLLLCVRGRAIAPRSYQFATCTIMTWRLNAPSTLLLVLPFKPNNIRIVGLHRKCSKRRLYLWKVQTLF
jgi:hypothetical protein